MLLPTKRWVDRRTQRNRTAALSPRRLAIEPLEPRRMLAADGVDLNFADHPDVDEPGSIHGRKWNDLNGNVTVHGSGEKEPLIKQGTAN